MKIRKDKVLLKQLRSYQTFVLKLKALELVINDLQSAHVCNSLVD